jgi:ketosteroid isomerase-like protein
MSRDNVETIRRIYDALARDDLDAAFRFMADDIEYVNPPYAVEAGSRRGHEGIRENVEHMRGAFEHWRFQPEEFVDAGDKVVVVGTFEARGRDSGADVRGRMSRLWTLCDGRVVRYQWFDNETEAFGAAGLRHEGAP